MRCSCSNHDESFPVVHRLNEMARPESLVWLGVAALFLGACQTSTATQQRATEPIVVVEKSDVVLVADEVLDDARPPSLVGKSVLVEWGGVYYPAVILAETDAHHVRIHYEGYGAEWDEVVAFDRVVAGQRLDGSPIGAAPVAATNTHYDVGQARVGDHVSVEWGGSYWDARVLRVLSPTEVQIHYDGYGPEWDEVVGQARVRQRSDAVNTL